MARNAQRFTVYLDAELHQALKLKAALSGKTVSALIEEMVRQGLNEDEEDLRLLRERANDPVLTYEQFLAELKAHGVL
ncbi:MAG: ribbon-helix-helix protein, CopG family [Acidobacteriota bacterium]|nr:MAG: hypothetical protein KatS3mg007_2030 [Thermoanaerobaculum sp.]